MLKSVLGPGENKGFDTQPEARRRNLRRFRKVIKGFIEAQYRQHRYAIFLREFKEGPSFSNFFTVTEMMSSALSFPDAVTALTGCLTTSGPRL